MSYLDSGYTNDDDFDEKEKDIDQEIENCRKILDEGDIYQAIERVEEIIQLCIENERYSSGLDIVNRLLEISPYNSEYWLKKGTLLNGLCEFEEALLAFEKSLSLNPGDADVYIEKSIAEENIGEISRAKESLQAAIDMDSQNSDAYFSLGILFQRQNNWW